MKQETNGIKGKAIYVNESYANISIARYAGPEKSASDFLDVVRATDFLPEPETDFFQKLASEGIRWLEQAHETAVMNEIVRQGLKMKSQITDIKESAARDLVPVQEAYSRLMDSIQKSSSSVTGDYLVSLEYLEIVEGKAKLTEASKQRIREYYTIRIENEWEAELCENLQLVKQAWDQVVADLRRIDAPLHAYRLIGQWGSIFRLDDKENLSIDYSAFSTFRMWQTERFKKHYK